ncbi:MAG: glycosyl hydrolase 108 family protein [Pseudomonadota bacterium]
MNFGMCFDRLISHEGGFSDDRNDPGNWTGGRVGVGLLKGTKFGIAANTYGDIDIKNLTLEEAKSLYYRDWWLKCGADQLDGAIVFQMWDFAVNAGMSTAKRALQRVARVADDGQIGPLTIRAVRAMSTSDVIMRYNAQRLRYYTSLSTFGTFGKGWVNRVAGQLEYGAEDSE